MITTILIKIVLFIIGAVCASLWPRKLRKVNNPHRYRSADAHYWTWERFTPEHLFTDEDVRDANKIALRYTSYLKPSTQRIVLRIVIACVAAFSVGFLITVG